MANEKYTLVYIQNLIDSKAEENTHLEFKNSSALSFQDRDKKEISRDVSSFANADGAILIYGLAEINNVADHFDFIDGKKFTKEWLEQVIDSTIERKIMPNVLIHPIRVSRDFTRTMYVVEIPRSSNAPHQASDGRFYRRSNSQRILMEEYEVRDAYSRIHKTQLKIHEVQISGSPEYPTSGKMEKYHATVEIFIENVGSAIENQYKVEVKIPDILPRNVATHLQTDFFSHHLRREGRYDVYSFPNSSPLFQNEISAIPNVKFNIMRDYFSYLQQTPIFIKLYFSGGVVEKQVILTDNLKHSSSKKPIHPLSENCFNGGQ